MNKNTIHLLAALLLGGCANTHYASFATKTSLAVVDVDTAPVEASVAFSRTEGYVGPRLPDGSVYPVVGFINTQGRALQRETQQVFAGGKAALRVLGGNPDTSKDKPTCGKAPPLFLTTGTSVGLRVSFAQDGTVPGVVPSSFNLGYRRKELALVPVDKDCQPSVLATHDSDAGARAAAGEPKLRFGIAQYFATGEAAEALAADPEIQALFKRNAKRAADAVGAFTDRERLQLRSTLDALACASALSDAQFNDVALVNARELGLFPEKGYDMVMQATAGGPRRARYAELLSLRAGADDTRTALMEMHKARVCELAQAK